MLDDTCYLIGFDKIEFAVYSLMLLNGEITRQFLKSITFADAKRTFTKDVLMRIDILALARQSNKTTLKVELDKLNEKYQLKLGLDLWDSFIDEMKPLAKAQTAMFF